MEEENRMWDQTSEHQEFEDQKNEQKKSGKKEKSRKENRNRENDTEVSLKGNLLVKMIAFLLFVVILPAAFVGGVFTAGNLYLGSFQMTAQDIISEDIERTALNRLDHIEFLLKFGNDRELEIFLRDAGLYAEVSVEGSEEVAACYGKVPENAYYVFERGGILPIQDYTSSRLVKLYVPTFTNAAYFKGVDYNEADYYSVRDYWIAFLHYFRYEALWCTVAGIPLSILLFLFLMCSAGHRNGKKGYQPSFFHLFPFEVIAGIYCFLAAGLGFIALNIVLTVEEKTLFTSVYYILGMAVFLFLTALTMAFCMEFSARVKYGKWWQNTIVYKIVYFCAKMVGSCLRLIIRILSAIPLVPFVSLGILGISGIEFILLFIYHNKPMMIMVLWFLEKLILVPIILFTAVQCRDLKKAGRELAEGNLSHKVDTKYKFFAVKEHAESLNHIGDGLSLAVREKMKSEHLKTELITNVSHDIKTPLTSIINYADLLGNADLTREEIDEYSEVLVRQSRRLKKLLEDLLEASKATTGNLEVNLEECNIGVLLTQAAGEYEQRFQEKNLQMILRSPEEDVYVLADGRHLWRVFDNLLNNICKYAQEGTRVFLTLEEQGKEVTAIFRNTSKYELEISGDELKERFVRGDKSRNMEGNGLGLSIAQSLVELQKGRMEIVTDGDLFKVILTFPKAEEGKRIVLPDEGYEE